MRRHFTLIVVLVMIALGGCGTRGALYLPPPQVKDPGTPANAPKPASPATADLNTAREASR